MKLVEQKHLKAIHQMADMNWCWVHNDGYGYITECKLYYNDLKPIGYARFEKRHPDGKLYVLEFEKENDYLPKRVQITDRTWGTLMVGYDKFLLYKEYKKLKFKYYERTNLYKSVW